MGVHQGRRRLLKGVSRPLTVHEYQRGYVFISKDRDLNEVLNPPFNVDVAGTIVSGRRVDVSGRVHIPRGVLNAIAPCKKVSLRIVSPTLIEIKVEK